VGGPVENHFEDFTDDVVAVAEDESALSITLLTGRPTRCLAGVVLRGEPDQTRREIELAESRRGISRANPRRYLCIRNNNAKP
jgi:hypothetical protein